MTHRSFQARRAHFHSHYVEEEVKKVMESYATPTCIHSSVHYLLSAWLSTEWYNDNSFILLFEVTANTSCQSHIHNAL